MGYILPNTYTYSGQPNLSDNFTYRVYFFFLLLFIFDSENTNFTQRNYTCLINGNVKDLLTIFLIDIIPTNNSEIWWLDWPFPLLAKYLKHYCSTTFFFLSSLFFFAFSSFHSLLVWAESTNKRTMIMNLNICREKHTHCAFSEWN